MIRDLISRIHTQSFECTSFKELYDKAKMPIVPLTIFGKTYHFIIDTGADLNLIRTSFANDLPEANSDMAGGTDVKDVDHSQVTHARFIWGILALSVFGCAFFFFKKRNRF